MSSTFSDQARKKIEEIISRYPQKKAALLPVLHFAQQEFGQLSENEEKIVSELLDIKPVEVREVVTFYTMFNPQPIGKYHIQICSNLSCTLMGAENLVDYLKEKIQVNLGETSQDKKYTLTTVECLGACEQAPCMMVNFDYHGNLDKKKIDEILDKLT